MGEGWTRLGRGRKSVPKSRSETGGVLISGGRLGERVDVIGGIRYALPMTTRLLWFLLLLTLTPAASGAERTLHYFGVYCNAYPGDAGGINAGVSSDQVIVSHIFNEYVSPTAWGVEVRKVEVMGEKATKAGIEAAWSAFVEGIGQEDTVYVHFSGHGIIRDRAAGEQFLQTCDLGEISRNAWAGEIETLPCRLKILITDCCSSYPEEFIVAEGNEPVIPWKNVYYLLMKHEGFVNITAASPGQAAYGTDAGGFLTINLESDMQRFRTWEEVFASTQSRVLNESTEQLRGAGIAGEPQKPLAYSLGTPTLEIGVDDAPVAASLEYIMEDSADLVIDREELYAFGLEQLYLARNEIFARHGFDFSSAFLRDYFGSLSWYQRHPGFKTPELSKIEATNVATILSVEKELGGPYLGGKMVLPGDGGSQAEPPDLFPYSSERTLSRSVVQTLTLPELSIARNEIFARHGFPFSSKALREYFGRKSWYVRDDSATDPDFNTVEKHNIWLIEKIERIQGGAHKW